PAEEATFSVINRITALVPFGVITVDDSISHGVIFPQLCLFRPPSRGVIAIASPEPKFSVSGQDLTAFVASSCVQLVDDFSARSTIGPGRGGRRLMVGTVGW